MFSKLTKTLAALALIAAVGVTIASTDAFAGPRQCWRCVGGWCCY